MFAFWIVLEIALASVVVVLLATQVIIPLFVGSPLFPMFQFKKEDKELTEVVGEIQKEKIKIEVAKLTKELDKLHERLEQQPTTEKGESKNDAS